MRFSPQPRAIFAHQNFKSVPKLTCFVHFDLWMCFAPQRRAIFSTSQVQKALRTWGFLYIFTCKWASRHNGVQFLISLLSSYPRTRRCSKPTFRTSGTTNHWKNTACRDFSNIWRVWIFFLLTFALLHLRSSDFTSAHLLCRLLHIVGSLLFKLPSIITLL